MSTTTTEFLSREPLIRESSSAHAVLKALAYFDLFHYPLTNAELHQYLGDFIPEDELNRSLESLIGESSIFFNGSFYSLQNNPLLYYRRMQGNKLADELLPKAHKIGRILHHIPYVRGIGISGSLSKNFADEKSDIDFFVITCTDRLWIARTLMHVIKKISFIVGKQHWFCLNYYVDESSLLIQEQNIFTAIEIRTLLPVDGQQAFDDFFKINDWTKSILPACKTRKTVLVKKSARRLKKIFEWCLNNKVGDWLDNYLYKVTTRRWNRKIEAGKKNDKGLQMGLITGKHFARSNPGAFQERILARYTQRLIEMGIDPHKA